MRSDNLRAAPQWITPEMVGRILALAMPGEVAAVPIVQVPTPGVKPKLTLVSENSPVASTHSRRAEEGEAASNGPTRAAPPRRPFNPHPTNAAELAAGREVYIQHRKARAQAQIEADRPAFQVAFDRGISIADLARALGQNVGTVSLHTRMAGFRFGRRQQLAEPLTREQLIALADPAISLPELRCDRLRRERNARWSKYKRDNRAADVARRKAERLAAAEQRAKERADAIEDRRREREAAAEERRREREEAKERARRRRHLKRIPAAAPRPAKKVQRISEVEKPAPRQAAVAAPSREPAVPAAQQPPAHPIFRPTPGAARHLSYAERMSAAVAHLRARHFTVRRWNPDEIIARWQVTGQYGLLSNEELVQLAQQHGLELRA